MVRFYQLLIIFDLNAVPGSQWTQAEKGSSCVDIVGLGDKRQIT